jgi:hypothetical protein
LVRWKKKEKKKEPDPDIEPLLGTKESAETPEEETKDLEIMASSEEIAVDKEKEMNSNDESGESSSDETEKAPTGTSTSDELPSSYEIEYRTRVRFPAPEILAAAAEIGERVTALEADLANIKQLVALMQEKIAKGFDITESSSAIFSSGEPATGFEILGTKKAGEGAEEEEEPEELDDAFMTLL